jgi:hypothetical protein
MVGFVPPATVSVRRPQPLSAPQVHPKLVGGVNLAGAQPGVHARDPHVV